jgi:hypothetical protein
VFFHLFRIGSAQEGKPATTRLDVAMRVAEEMSELDSAIVKKKNLQEEVSRTLRQTTRTDSK